jgi:hypothetical protein
LGSAKNQIQLYTARDGWQQWPILSKEKLAEKITRLAEQLLADSHS